MLLWLLCVDDDVHHHDYRDEIDGPPGVKEAVADVVSASDRIVGGFHRPLLMKGYRKVLLLELHGEITCTTGIPGRSSSKASQQILAEGSPSLLLPFFIYIYLSSCSVFL